MLNEAPVRMCCGQRHSGVQCPDGKVMCCICFNRVSVDELSVDPDDGKKWDVCITCDRDERAMMEQKSEQ